MEELERTIRWASTEPTAFVVALFVVQTLILAIHEMGHVLGARSQILSRAFISASGALCTGGAGVAGLIALALVPVGAWANLLVFGCFADCACSLSPLASDGRKVRAGLWSAAAKYLSR